MSDNNDNVVSIFDKFSLVKGGVKDESSDFVLETYQAAIIERSGRRPSSIRIYYSDGSIEQVNYAHRKYDLSISPDRLGISFTTGVAFMRGKNLRLLLDDLQEERIRCLQPFVPSRHKAPKEGSVVIYSIEWKSNSQVRKDGNLTSNAE